MLGLKKIFTFWKRSSIFTQNEKFGKRWDPKLDNQLKKQFLKHTGKELEEIFGYTITTITKRARFLGLHKPQEIEFQKRQLQVQNSLRFEDFIFAPIKKNIFDEESIKKVWQK